MAKSRHVYENYTEYTFKNRGYRFRRVGIGVKWADSLSFNSICGEHDFKFFEEIDGILDFENISYEQLLKKWLRALMHEHYKNIVLTESFLSYFDGGFAEENSSDLKRRYWLSHCSLAVFGYLIDLLLKEIYSGRSDRFKFDVRVFRRSEVVASAVFGLEAKLIGAMGSPEELTSYVLNRAENRTTAHWLGIFPYNDKTYCILGHDSKNIGNFDYLRDQFMNTRNIQLFLTSVLFSYGETWLISEDAYSALDSHQISRIGVEANRLKHISQKGKSTDLDLFELCRRRCRS